MRKTISYHWYRFIWNIYYLFVVDISWKLSLLFVLSRSVVFSLRDDSAVLIYKIVHIFEKFYNTVFLCAHISIIFIVHGWFGWTKYSVNNNWLTSSQHFPTGSETSDLDQKMVFRSFTKIKFILFLCRSR
jgi:hypothetical protein